MKNIHIRKNFIIVSLFLFPILGFVIGQKKATNFTSYRDTIPGTTISFEMIAIPGGKFLMGSPQNEKGRRQDENPLHSVEIDSFWIGKYEIMWDEYELFVYPELAKQNKFSDQANKYVKVDAVTQPTPPYEDMSFGMGKSGYPAVNMTQYAALMYCKWLTAKTGHFYRLPTEAEWEYACRSGSNTAYSFGDDVGQLNEYAWYNKNSSEKYHKVGTKKPNNWGLFDMHGNVAEWTLDQYIPDFYSSLKEISSNPWANPDKLYPRTVRGGSWADEASELRSAARIGSQPKWKERDPQIPKSDWWNTDASFVGFRIIRPLKDPSPAEIEKYFAAPLKDY
jgi:formylglycine-generating enzyme required for sulfatase activity